MLIDGAPLGAPAAPLHDLLAVGRGTAPDEDALVSAERRISWRGLEEASSRLAGGYLALGLEPGNRIASLMPNRIALVVHYLACFKAGLVATPLNYRYTFREIDHALEVSGASASLAHAERTEDLAASKLVGSLQDRPGRPEEAGGGPPPPARSRLTRNLEALDGTPVLRHQACALSAVSSAAEIRSGRSICG